MGQFLQLLAMVLQLNVLYTLGLGMNLGYSDPRLMMGNSDLTGEVQGRNKDPVLLNCFSRHLDQQGNVASQMTVNILPQNGSPAVDYWYGNGKGSGLSGRIQIFSNLKAAGKAYIFITERASANNACSNDGFGKIILSDKSNPGKRFGFGHSAYRFGAGYEKAYLGWGKSTYDYGNYLARFSPGFGGAYGGGYGHTTGFGIGGPRMGFGGGHGLTGDGVFLGGQDSDEGAVTVVNVAPGVLTSGVVDNVGFDNLEDLAGRGVMVCSGITYDGEWNPVCLEPNYACCSLKYDNVELSLVG